MCTNTNVNGTDGSGDDIKSYIFIQLAASVGLQHSYQKAVGEHGIELPITMHMVLLNVLP